MDEYPVVAEVIGSHGWKGFTAKTVIDVSLPSHLNKVLEHVTDSYFEKLEKVPRADWPSKSHIGIDILRHMRGCIYGMTERGECDELCGDNLYQIPWVFVAKILLKIYHFANVCYTDDIRSKYRELAVYKDDGRFEGVYWIVIPHHIKQMIRDVTMYVTEQAVSEVLHYLELYAPVKVVCHDPRYTAVNNGIWDDAEKKLLPFTPELVFMSKIATDYRHDAVESSWDVESWISEIDGSSGTGCSLWDVLAMAVRPNRNFKKAVFLYDDGKYSGKKLYCQLLRNLIGCSTIGYVDMNSTKFAGRFVAHDLCTKQAVIGNQNISKRRVAGFNGMLRIAIGHPVLADRRYKDVFMTQFCGIVVQCYSNLPVFCDMSSGLWKKYVVAVKLNQIPGPYAACEDMQFGYLGRKDVKEYVLKKLLEACVEDDETCFVCEFE